MDELVIAVGTENDVRFEVLWERPAPKGIATDATRGALRLLLRGTPIWFGDDASSGFLWTWVELLEFLANAWPFLVLEDGAPFGLQVAAPAALRAEALRLADDLPGDASEEISSELEAFFEVHDLSRALQGAVVPGILIVRTGDIVTVTSDGRRIEVTGDRVLRTLEEEGELLARRLDHADDERSRKAVETWRRRDALLPSERIAIATGLGPAVLAVIQDGDPPEEVWEVSGDRLVSNELLAAARLCGDLPSTEIRRVVDAIRGANLRSTPSLDAVRNEAEALLASLPERVPHDQGYELARWLRRRLELAENSVADPAALLDAWNVEVTEVKVSAGEIDAIACWGPSHGPTVFVNALGRHSQSDAGRRSTLAHELLHLLVDRSGALPLADVLGGRSSWRAEARARAFAAEFLLPRSVAGQAFQGEVEPAAVLPRLRRRYRVSAEIVAWQARNSEAPLAPTTYAFLRQHVSHPGRF